MFPDEANPTQLKPGGNTIVAVDALGAGAGDLVLFCQGSSARMTTGMKTLPIDASVVGLVDTVEVLGKRATP
jgi:ethanolamine utilization protein EutN